MIDGRRWRVGLHVSFALAALTCVVLIGINSFTRIRQFTPDSMSYVDVARNFTTGRGLSQSALGFGRADFTPDDPIPSPFTAHAPGFSLLIALVSTTGASFENAALLLPVVFLAAALAAAFLLARECHDESIAWFTVAVLLNYYPLRHVSAVAWSETTTIFFALCALWLTARYTRREPSSTGAWAIGLTAGLAFAIRYPMGPIVVVTGLAVVSRGRDRAARDTAAFVLGVICSAGPVVARNLWLTHTLAGAASNPFATPLLANAMNALWALSVYYQPYYLEVPSPILELRMLGVSLAVAGVALIVHRSLGRTLRDVVLRRDGPRWIALWALSYLAALVVARSLTWFDDINHRLTVPGGIGLAMLWAAFTGKAVRATGLSLAVVSAALLLAGIGREAWFMRETPPVPRGMPATSRLQWIQANTTDRDLIVGDYTMDVPFFFPGRRAITFEHYPYTAKLTSARVASYLERHCREYDRAYLIVHKWFRGNPAGWTPAFGPFVADLMTAPADPYPGYHLLAGLSDSYVFQIAMPPCPQ